MYIEGVEASVRWRALNLLAPDIICSWLSAMLAEGGGLLGRGRGVEMGKSSSSAMLGVYILCMNLAILKRL